MSTLRWVLVLLVSLTLLTGCKKDKEVSQGSAGSSGSSTSSGELPVFSLAWSEYPSWSVFGVADELGIIDGKPGATGEIEEKWGVDIELKVADYPTCLTMFASDNCDSVCMTNMDALIVSPKQDCVAVMPTSTSDGADACIVAGIDSLDDLKAHNVYGLEDSVSEYCFVRCIEEIEKKEKKGYKPEDFKFTNQDPGAAAIAMKQRDETHQAIMVWNPFVLQTLIDRPDSKVLFDSSMIPGEIVDMIVISKKSLGKPGSEKFIKAVAETFYRMNDEIDNPKTHDETLVQVGKKFSNLGLKDMEKVVEQTKFYKTADDAITLMDSDKFKDTMKIVGQFCSSQKLVDEPSYGFDPNTPVQLTFDSSYLKALKDGK